MIPPDFSLNALHSTEEEMGRLSSSRKGLGQKWGSRLGAKRWWALAPPGQSVACIRARGSTDEREHNSARREMLVGSLGQPAPLALIGRHDTRGFFSSQCSSISFRDRSCALISGQELLFLDDEYWSPVGRQPTQTDMVVSSLGRAVVVVVGNSYLHR